MDMRVLTYYLTIAEEENITKASKILHVTQPTLSRQIMQLEEELGRKLFIRTKHRIILTEVGTLFKRRAEEIISLMEKSKYELNQENQVSGKISIGSGEFLTFSHLAKIIAKVETDYPNIEFDIHSGTANSIKEGIEKGTLDTGLIFKSAYFEKYNSFKMPDNEIWGVFVHKKSPLAKKKYITKNDLLSEKIIISERTGIQNKIKNWAGKDYSNFRITGTYNIMGNAAYLVQEKLAIAIGLQRNYTYENLKFLPLSPSLTETTVLIWKKNPVISPAFNIFIKYLQIFLNSE